MVVVCPLDKALGWLTLGVLVTVTDRLPCATAQDLLAILQAMKAAGSLKADLQVI